MTVTVWWHFIDIILHSSFTSLYNVIFYLYIILLVYYVIIQLNHLFLNLLRNTLWLRDNIINLNNTASMKRESNNLPILIYMYILHDFIHSSFHPLIYWSIHSFIHHPIHWSIERSTHSSCYSLNYMYSSIDPSTLYLFIHIFIQYSLIYPSIHSFIHPFIHPSIPFLIRWEGLFHGDGCIYEVYGDPEKLKVEKCDPITLVINHLSVYLLYLLWILLLSLYFFLPYLLLSYHIQLSISVSLCSSLFDYMYVSLFLCPLLSLSVPLFSLDSPLPSGQFMSFFSLLKHVFDSLNDHKGDVNKVIVWCVISYMYM